MCVCKKCCVSEWFTVRLNAKQYNVVLYKRLNCFSVHENMSHEHIFCVRPVHKCLYSVLDQYTDVYILC